ncbi:Putative serine protease HhoA precursor [Roseimaritima multifibrata]|uniref:Serine protease HhoA n=1 Tax=Roseimaritima multifibrata TaxID=1930274 RepID=A0A517M9G9_9BACT|nr:transglutaminase family protein [Roseimaritima multifibrata]QDS91538.1 Putative serine protease HhoA precursor [Roseimaritima multifibrata]
MLRLCLVLIFTMGFAPLSLPTLWADDEENAGTHDESFQPLIEKVRPSVVTIKVRGRDGDQIQMGTGFVIDAAGLIATNFHVISEGRSFTVETRAGRKLPVTAVEASDRTGDLALIRVDVSGDPLPPLSLASGELPQQGVRVLAFGNPLGLRDSVVAGIVSAVREVEGREMIQLAIPVQPGNSGGPLVDTQGSVVGIINMKSAIDDNLGFAIPISQLVALRENPNPVSIDRWVRLGKISEKKWTPLFGATWQQRGGLVTARGLGNGFGGRSLCLSSETPDESPKEIAVEVRLDDEAGAAGLAFHSDGQHRHYGFYASNGNLRLTCFKGSSVYSWQVLEELGSEHYLPGQWNHLRVRFEPGRLKCFVNGHLVIESTDQQLTSGRFGLVKFRDTNPDFKGFQFGENLPDLSLSEPAKELLDEVVAQPDPLSMVDASQVSLLGQSGDAVSRELHRQAVQLEQQAEHLRKLAADVQASPTLGRLAALLADPSDADSQLLEGSLLIAKLDNPDIDVDAYVARVDAMAEEIQEDLAADADAVARRKALHRYLFEENGFHGGRAEYDHPANSHLNSVIDDREGLPITLSILYMELGKRLGLSVEGVGLPGHFVVKHVITDDEEQLVDVFERGKLLSRKDAEAIVAAYVNRPMTDDDLRGQTVDQILARVLNNLIGVAGRTQDGESIHRYCGALVAVRPESIEARMMRSQVRAMTDRRGGAIEDLDWLIDRNPPGFDHDSAIRLREALLRQESLQ